MSSHDNLMKPAREHEAEFFRELTTKDEIILPSNISEGLSDWHEFISNWTLRKRYLRVVLPQEQQARLDYWDKQIQRHDA